MLRARWNSRNRAAQGTRFRSRGTVSIAGVAGVLALLSALPALGQSGGASTLTLPDIVDDREAQPPLCSRVEHVGVIGYLVDQAWQSYRRIERSSPLRVGWCSCAKRCEAIDRFAAQEEKVAFRANELGHDPSVPPEQRTEYRRLATEMFARRNRTVGEFRDCIDRSRPPLTQRRAASSLHADHGRQLQGRCSVDAKPMTLAQQWKVWCDAYQREFDKIVKDFINEFKIQKQMQAEVTFITRVARNGAHRVRGGRAEPPGIVGRGAHYQNRVLKVLPGLDRLVPSGAGRAWYEFRTKMTTKEIINEPIDCPKL